MGLIAAAMAIFLTRNRRGRQLAPSGLHDAHGDRLSDAPLHSPPSMSQEHGSPIHGSDTRASSKLYVSVTSYLQSVGVLDSRNRTLRIRVLSRQYTQPKAHPCRMASLDSSPRCKLSPVVVTFRVVLRIVRLWSNDSALLR